MSQETDRTGKDKIHYRTNGALAPEEVEELRLTVGWPRVGVYRLILRESLFHISARLDGRLVGFLNITGSPHGDLLIHDVCVHPDLHGKGVGTRLMELGLDACRSLQPQGVNILFEEKNRPFFERFGFKLMHGGYMNVKELANVGKKTNTDNR